MKKVIIPQEFEEFVVERKQSSEGELVILLFENKYGASIINLNGSRGLELAVLFEDRLTFDTPITDDVLEGLDETTLTEALTAIKALPKQTNI